MKTLLDKNEIRLSMKKKRLSLDEKTFLSYSQSIINQLIQHPSYQESTIIGIYVSTNNEVNTLSLIEETLKTKRVCVPKVYKNKMDFYEIHSLNDLKEGHFHILEPTTQLLIKPNQIDLMIVPMLAFDSNNHRVGYGKGYYDRYLSCEFNGYKIGLAFSFQQVSYIPIDQFDLPLDEIIQEVS